MVDYGHFGSLGPGHLTGNGFMDFTEQVWWLAWVADALPRVHGMFLAQGQNYPLGQNFGVNGSMLALGVVFMPITKLFGPVVTWNVLLRLALAASATSMCLVLRRWTTWWPAAFLGGLLYGFSAYTSQLGLYLFLIFVPLPPLIFLFLHEILVRQRWRPVRTGVLLGLVCVLQFFISTEVLAATLVMGAIATALLIFIYRHAPVERWRYAATAFTYFLGVVCLLLFYPVWFTFAGPQHINGPPGTVSFWAAWFPMDLLSPIVPGSHQWLDPRTLAPAVQHLINGGLLYLGLPLIVVVVCFTYFFRKQRAILFAGAMATIALVLSFGPRLGIDAHRTQIILPSALFEHLPALDGFQTGRFALFTDLFVAGMFAIGIDELWKRLRRSRHLARILPRWSMLGRTAVVGAIAVAVTLPLVPSQTVQASPTNVPTFFTSTAVDAIPPGSVVLAYPYPGLYSTTLLSADATSIMLDQAVVGMRFKLIGGFGWFPSPIGHDGTTNPALLHPQSVQTFFEVAYCCGTSAQRALLLKSNLTTDLREFLRQYDVQTVIVLAPSPTVISHVTAAIGQPVESGGLTVWFHVKQRLARVSIVQPPPPTQPPATHVYVVQPGDTLWALAARYLGNPLRYQELFALNRGISQADGHTLVDPDLIYPGMKLLFPADATGLPAA